MFLVSDMYWEIRSTKEKGRGIFAKQDIKAGTVIGDYTGKVVPPDFDYNEDEGFYLMYYHDRASIFPALSKPGVHLINHSCTPNTWMYTYYGHTLFFAIRHIFAGEEFTVSYLLGPKADCEKGGKCDHFCICGSKFCNRNMHMSQEKYEKWSTFHNKQEKKTKKKRVYMGKELAFLEKYPKSLPDSSIYDLFGNSEKSAVEYQDSSLPTVGEIRKRIRQTGRYINLAKLRTTVYGVVDGVSIKSNEAEGA